MTKHRLTQRSGITLIGILGYVAVLGIVIPLALNLFLDSMRLTALGTTALDKMGQTEDIRREFREAVRECVALCPKVGTFQTGEDVLVLKAHHNESQGEDGRYVIFQTLGSPMRLRKIELAQRDGKLEPAYVKTFPLELESVRFEHDGDQLVSLDLVLKREHQRSKREPTVHRFTAFMRGMAP